MELELHTSQQDGVATQLDPKGAIGATKPQLWLIPREAMNEEAGAMNLGAKKYGAWNWRKGQVCMSTYLSAALRHLFKVIDQTDEGDIDPESMAHHLGHVRACCGIMLDAKKCGTLVDDRVKGGES